LETLEKRSKNITNKKSSLGFTKLDKAEIITGLNQLLADYEIHYQKLRNFHWNVVGPDFFDLHDKFEELYNEAQSRIDEIAEKIRILDSRPYSTYQEFLSNGNIKEVSKQLSALEMVNEVLKDFELLINDITQVVTIARSIGDIGTEDLLMDYLKGLEKHHWMLKSFIKQ
jgi:starvation-inducible DNA-binding protein